MRYHELCIFPFLFAAKIFAFTGTSPQSVSILMKKHASDILFLKEMVGREWHFVEVSKTTYGNNAF